jgi:hypothetical protein
MALKGGVEGCTVGFQLTLNKALIAGFSEGGNEP